MKTNVTLSSPDRDLFGVKIRQQTKEGFLSLSDLQEAYDKAKWIHSWPDKQYSWITRGKDFIDRCYYVLSESGKIKVQKDVFIEMVNEHGVAAVLKGLGLWKTTSKNKKKTVLVDQYIWTLIALEMNPMIYAKVVVWLTDNLIFNRIEAGDRAKSFTSALARTFTDPSYAKLFTAMNEKVFGFHESGMRDNASMKELRQLAEIEATVVKALEFGWVKTEEQVLELIRNY